VNGEASEEVDLVVDGDDLAVVGDETAVERFLRRIGLWEFSCELDLTRLTTAPAAGADVLGVVSEIRANSGRYVKLTKESAERVKKSGLMKSKNSGESHLMIGEPGEIGSWLQAVTRPASFLNNPALMSGLGSLMSQASGKHATAEILRYLESIDAKVDEVLQKQDDAVVAGLVGMEHPLDRAMAILDESGEVDDDTWSTVDQIPAAIGRTLAYALLQLEAIAKGLESANVGDLARKADSAEVEVLNWLAVLAHCIRLQEEFDVVQLDRKMHESPEQLSDSRRAMKANLEDCKERLQRTTEHLLAKMDNAVTNANGKLVWTRTKTLAVVASCNHVANDVHRFQALLGIETNSRLWEVEHLGRVADVGSRAIQKTKDATPYVASLLGITAAGLVAVKQLSDDE